jgi:ATP-binding cassette subfamily G (WHITE) protein 2 (PDR)
VVSNAEDAQKNSQDLDTLWNEIWASSIEIEEVLGQIAAFKKCPARDKVVSAMLHECHYAASFTTQLCVMTRRVFQDY